MSFLSDDEIHLSENTFNANANKTIDYDFLKLVNDSFSEDDHFIQLTQNTFRNHSSSNSSDEDICSLLKDSSNYQYSWSHKMTS